jgi:2-polyprenyl-3-methyl-5-hydroxy-6-metoxy-1,4-benzoquinol methylase
LEPTDNTGNKILEVIADASRFNHWMYQTIQPFLHGNILEIGSGIGNISTFFLTDNTMITLSDTDEFYIQKLKSKFHSFQNLKRVLLIDIQDPFFETTYASMKEQYDSIFLLNVLEHLADDNAALKNCNFLLKPGGTLLILTPAYSFLYSSLDKALGHYRRYTRSRLNSLLQMNSLVPKKSFYFNMLGIVAWLYGKVLRLKTIPATKMSLYNKLTPLAKFIDKIMFRKIGLSAIIVGEKNNL